MRSERVTEPVVRPAPGRAVTNLYYEEINPPLLRVQGCTTKSFTWHPTVGSRVVAEFQARNLPGVRKVRWWIHQPSATWRVQVAATSFDALLALVRATREEWGL